MAGFYSNESTKIADDLRDGIPAISIATETQGVAESSCFLLKRLLNVLDDQNKPVPLWQSVIFSVEDNC